MARRRYDGTAADAAGNVQVGAKVRLYRRLADGTSSGVLASTEVYTTENGSTLVTYPLTTDAFGRVAAWAEPGAFYIENRQSNDSTLLEPDQWDSVSGRDGGTPSRLLNGGHRVLEALSGMQVHGHSLSAGAGATNQDFDVMTRVASILGAREINYGVGGAVLVWGNTANAAGDGGFATVLQNVLRRSRPGGTVTVQANAGASVVRVSTALAAKLADFDPIMIGQGTNAELRYITSGGRNTGTGDLTLGQALSNTHPIGDQVFRSAGHDGGFYVGGVPLYVLWYGGNDLGRVTPVDLVTPFKEALRAIIARCRCSAVFQGYDAVYFSATHWGFVGAQNLNSGIGVMQTATNGATFTITTPSDYPGGTIVIGCPGVTGQGGLATLTLDGAAAGTIDTRTFGTGTGKTGYGVKRIAVGAGRHTIVGTISNIATGFQFDFWGTESPEPPLVVLPKANRFGLYNLWPSERNQQVNTTLTAGISAGSGATTANLASTTGMIVGQTITFGYRLGNAETRTITGFVSSQPIWVGGLTQAHANGEIVTVGAQDADIITMNTWFDSVIAEFTDGRVIGVDMESVIGQTNPSTLQVYDLVHLNDYGDGLAAAAIVEAIEASGFVTMKTPAYFSTPTAPLPSEVNFMPYMTTPEVWTNMPNSATATPTEIFSKTTLRRKADLRRCFECRLMVVVGVVGVAGSALRLQYSVDAGVTWHYFGRTYAFAEDITPGVAVNVAGLVDSGWVTMNPESMTSDTLMRVVGTQGNGTADPTFHNIVAQFR